MARALKRPRAGPGSGLEELGPWIARLFAHEGLLRMGHNQCADDRNLGLGWIYYGLARVLQPRWAVVIGSYRGFVPLVIGRACAENRRHGRVCFIDPGLVDDFWHDPAATRRWFAAFGIDNVEHHRMTTQEFITSAAYAALDQVGLLFIDGYHSAAQARFDHEAFIERLAPRALVLFHDSLGERESSIYGAANAYTIDVRRYLDHLEQDARFALLDLPFGTGLTILRRRGGADDELLSVGAEGRL